MTLSGQWRGLEGAVAVGMSNTEAQLDLLPPAVWLAASLVTHRRTGGLEFSLPVPLGTGGDASARNNSFSVCGHQGVDVLVLRSIKSESGCFRKFPR